MYGDGLRLRSARYSASGDARRLAHALRQHDLHDVAVKDVALGALHRRDEIAFAEFRDSLGRACSALRAESLPAAQIRKQFLQTRFCGAVRFRCIPVPSGSAYTIR